jgi:hypothetical protein
MSRAAELCVDSALRNGVDRNCSVGPSQRPFTFDWLCDTDLVEQMPPKWWDARGKGYFLWKPYVIERAMRGIADGEVLIYSDAGVEFIAPVSPIIERMDQDVFLFGNNWEHAHWCKRDIVDEVWPNESIAFDYAFASEQEEAEFYSKQSWARFGKQVQASVIFFRVSDYTRQFVAEWLKWCLFEGGRLIDDSPSRAPNHPEFRENRHDQAILTTMAYREGLRLHAWPAVYNRFLGQEFVYSREGYPESDNYPALFHHHRFRNSDFEVNKNGSMDT